MCGIVGYIGDKEAQPILLASLKRLEYRGYDSAGIALLSNSKIVIKKRRGKIRDLEHLLKGRRASRATLGIAHTRWATHGAPSNVNAHPHSDGSRRISLVHNGIIENYAQIKSELLKKKHKFTSETDTEVISHLIEENLKECKDFVQAVRLALARLRGSYALAIINSDNPDMLVVARLNSPLVIGKGRSCNFVASDVQPLLKYTREVMYLDDNEMAVITKDDIKVTDLKGKEKVKPVNIIKWDIKDAQRSGFAHFMLKEIYEQPQVSTQIITNRINEKGEVHFQEMKLEDEHLKNINSITIVACGTAYHAGLVGKYIFEKLAKIPLSVDLSSEFRYRDTVLDKNSLIIAISQSGETADTLAAVRLAKDKGAKVLAICNVVGSSLTRDADSTIYTLAGPEIGVASTKAYTAQVFSLYLLGIYLAKIKESMPAAKIKGLINDLRNIPTQQEEVLRADRHIKSIARRHSHFGSFLFLGRNTNYPSALEGALKLKEISYIPAEGYAAGEMKHGPIALIDEYRAVVCIAVDSRIYEKMISNIQEIRSRRGRIIIIASDQNREIKDFAKEIIYIPKVNEFLSPLLVALPLQLLAYHIAVRRGCDVDQPRNLAKSVTVE
ncbi:MAG: glutamine--fructose-6-phosphate transaminase (isomerizing) [Candidatus Omnitrophica bacterium]|nr:glutamine--fructose-6-phosphate transaminase (isomerizing) [Candidatus Omnitrophota bacterium]